ncbi:MAG: sensor histidine kinase [Allomuricauda sp.]
MNRTHSRFNKKEYFKLVMFLTIFYTLWKIIKYINFLWLFKNNIPTFGKVQNPADYLDAIIIDWFVVIGFMSAVAYWIGKWYNFKKMQPIILLPLHLLLSFLLNFFIFPVQFLSYRIQDKIDFSNGYFRVLLDRVIKFMDINFLTYFSMLGIILLFYYFKGKKDEESAKAMLESQLMEARLTALNSQLQPHFIFNTLNGVSSLIDENGEKAQQMLAHLGEMLRTTFERNRSVLIDLENELGNLNNYIQILKIRFEEDLEVKMKVKKGLENIKVPNMFLQPIIENSIKHGYGYYRKKLAIEINVQSNDKNLLVTISNNGLPMRNDRFLDLDGGRGNGLKILRERFGVQYGTNYRFETKNLENKRGVITFIQLPV